MTKTHLIVIYVGILIGSIESEVCHFNMYGTMYDVLTTPVLLLIAWKFWKNEK